MTPVTRLAGVQCGLSVQASTDPGPDDPGDTSTTVARVRWREELQRIRGRMTPVTAAALHELGGVDAASTDPGPDDPGDRGAGTVAAELLDASTDPGPDDPGDGLVMSVARSVAASFNGSGAG